MTINETPTRAGRKEWIGLAVIALPCMLYSMDLTVLNLAVPSLSADLKPSSAGLLWIVDIYGFLVAGSLITMGTLGDRIGHRKLSVWRSWPWRCCATARYGREPTRRKACQLI
jgi:DHA2 family multidrug resistance protein-like MFS transporter